MDLIGFQARGLSVRDKDCRVQTVCGTDGKIGLVHHRLLNVLKHGCGYLALRAALTGTTDDQFKILTKLLSFWDLSLFGPVC